MRAQFGANRCRHRLFDDFLPQQIARILLDGVYAALLRAEPETPERQRCIDIPRVCHG
jgi:hypothetical protein